MTQPYLEVTFRGGKAIAAYLDLPRRTADTVARSEPFDQVIVVDRAADGRPTGLEIVDPQALDLVRLNDLLKRLDQPAWSAADLAPLHAA